MAQITYPWTHICFVHSVIFILFSCFPYGDFSLVIVFQKEKRKNDKEKLLKKTEQRKCVILFFRILVFALDINNGVCNCYMEINWNWTCKCACLRSFVRV